jgi:hypothetical protein
MNAISSIGSVVITTADVGNRAVSKTEVRKKVKPITDS